MNDLNYYVRSILPSLRVVDIVEKKAHFALGLGETKKKEGAEREALLLEVKRLYVSKRLSFRWTVVWSVDG